MRWCLQMVVVVLPLVLLLINSPTKSVAKHQDCIISPQSINIPWVWPQVLVTSWIPSDTTSSDPALQFRINYVDAFSDPSYGILQLHPKNLTIWSEGDESINFYSPVLLEEGWVNLTFEVKDNYTLRVTGSNEVVFSRRPDKLNDDIQDVVITGSNVTVNCASDELIWRVFGRKGVIVPLTPGGRGWHLGVYPSSKVVPTLTLEGGVNFTLGLKDKKLDSSSTAPLQPYKYYKFVLECLSRPSKADSNATVGFICFLKSQSTILKEMELPSRPRFLEVEGKSTKPFYILQKTVPLPYLTPTISTTQGPYRTRPTTHHPGGGGRGGGGGGAVKLGWSGWWAALAVVLACLLIFVIIMCFVSHYHRPKIEKLDPIWYTRKMSKRYLETMNLISEASQEHLENSPLPERRPLLARSCSVVVNVEDPNTTAPLRLWNAVSSGDVDEVEQVLATMTPDPEIMLQGWDTSPYEEAHRRGYHHILKILDAFMSKQPQLPDNDMIISVMQSYIRNVEAVFEAARGGQYRHGGGVDVLLRSYSLPGTIQDEHGQSLLHYAASVKLADGGPLWLAPDIRSLVENHNVYVNAVDFRGQTALHALAEKASTSDQNTCWDGKAVNVGQAWVNLATLIMKLGCDSRLSDNSSRCPDEIASLNENLPLAEELAKERANLGPITYSKCLSRYKDILEASKTGQISQMQELLREGVSVLPLGSRSDPLQEAIQGGHRDAVFLLLSAGAPLCAHGLIGDTPYEAAHSTPGLPALFPALVRRALCGQLEAEMQIIRGSNKVPELVRKGSKDIKTIIERTGHKLGPELNKWMEQRPIDSLRNFNEMLSTSASLGLSLICQLMGVAGVRLNPLPNEEQPLVLALMNSHHGTAYALCRDLKMNPYCAGITDDEIPEQLRNDLLQSELLLFEKKLHKAALDDVTMGNLLNDANGVSEAGCVRNPSKMFLYLLAELGLVTLLHRMRKALDDSFLDMVVHEDSGSTMLHIAAAYGKITMVEYLLSAGADHTCKTLGGLTAPHFAAARGHKKCMQYIIDYTKHQEKWKLSVLPHQIFNDFEENMKSYHLDVLSTAELDAISKAKEDFAKTELIISSRCEKSGITSEKCLREMIIKEQKLVKDLISDDFIIAVECDIGDFLHEVMRTDSRFKGTIVSRNPVFERTEFFLPETFEFFCELEDYHALHGGCISLGKNLRTWKDGETVDNLKSTQDQEFFRDSNFKHAFYKAAKLALRKFTFKTLALIPPFVHHSTNGISIFGLLKKKSRTNLVQLVITPVLKVPCLPDHTLRKRYQTQLQFSGHEHLANTDDNKWVYLSNFTYKSVLSALTEDELLVLWTCLYFNKLLSACWWLPKRQQRRIGCTWQSYPVGVDFPSSRLLISYFFDELMEVKEGYWKKENYMEKVISILKRASSLGRRKVSFRTDDSVGPPRNSISAVIAFLEKISVKNDVENHDDGLNAQKKFGKHGNANKAISKSSLNVDIE